MAVSFFCVPEAGAQSDAAKEKASISANAANDIPPDLLLLEFIAEFGDLDDSGFNIILQHALADEDQSRQAEQPENNNAK